MNTKIWIILIFIAAALTGVYFYTDSKEPILERNEMTTTQVDESKAEDVIKASKSPRSDGLEAVSEENPSNKTTNSTHQNKNEDIVKLIDSIEQGGALSTNDISKLMSDPEGFDQALYKLEESYYEPEYSYETKVKYQHFFNTSPFHLQGKAQLSNLQCSPKMCLAKVAGIQREQLSEYTQSVQSSESLPIKALAVGVGETHMLLAFSTDPEVNAFITREESDE